MTISVRDGGTFKEATPYVKDAAAWKAVQFGYVKDAGAWKQFFQALIIAISRTSATRTTTAPTAATATYRLDNDGNISTTFGPSAIAVRGTWATPPPVTNPGDFECRATLLTGSVTGTFGTWQGLDTSRSWSLSSGGGPSATSGSMTLEIRRASDLVVLDTNTITFTAESQ